MSMVLMLLWMGCGGTPPAEPAVEPATEPAAAPPRARPLKTMPRSAGHRDVRNGTHMGDAVRATFLDLPAERPIDRRVLPLIRKPIEGVKLEDAVPTAKERVDIYQDEGATKPNRVEFDLDRDGQIDEIWDVSEELVKRSFMPDVEGKMTVRQIWKDRRWKEMP